jgi:hypothetical protein
MDILKTMAEMEKRHAEEKKALLEPVKAERDRLLDEAAKLAKLLGDAGPSRRAARQPYDLNRSAKVLALLADGQHRTFPEIRKAVGTGSQTVSNLVIAGKIAKSGAGRGATYSLPQAAE